MESAVYSKDIVFPNKFQAELSDDKSYGKFVISPLQQGFGTTIGNILRRTLLSSIRGVTIDSLKIADVKHEYSVIDGVKEDVPTIIFNLRHIVFSSALDKNTIKVSFQGPKKVYASDLPVVNDLKIVNKDHFLFEITANKTIDMELDLVAGIGDVFVNQAEQQSLTEIYLDKHFSPVLNVACLVSNTQFNGRTDYEKLTLEVKTNGSISAEDAFKTSVAVLTNFLNAISDTQMKMYQNNFVGAGEKVVNESSESGINYNLFRRIDDLELSVRSANCLKNDGIEFLGDLVVRNENDMLRTPNFGRKSLNELKSILNQYHLKFGMEIEWPMKNQNEMIAEAQQYFDGE